MEIKKDFTQIPNTIIRDRRLSDSLFRTYIDLMAYSFGKNKAFPSQKRVASDLGKSRETINRQIAELTKLGYVTKKRRGYSSSNTYDFCDEVITNGYSNGDSNITSDVFSESHQLSQDSHSNNTKKKTKKNSGIELLRNTLINRKIISKPKR